MRALADEGIVAGESGAASPAGMLALANTANGRAKSNLGLRPSSCVLLVNTEGATDPESYTRIVGRSPKTVGGPGAAVRGGVAESGTSS
jgi:diaminopropionate ammonia-lyase